MKAFASTRWLDGLRVTGTTVKELQSFVDARGGFCLQEVRAEDLLRFLENQDQEAGRRLYEAVGPNQHYITRATIRWVRDRYIVYSRYDVCLEIIASPGSLTQLIIHLRRTRAGSGGWSATCYFREPDEYHYFCRDLTEDGVEVAGWVWPEYMEQQSRRIVAEHLEWGNPDCECPHHQGMRQDSSS